MLMLQYKKFIMLNKGRLIIAAKLNLVFHVLKWNFKGYIQQSLQNDGESGFFLDRYNILDS